MHHIFKTVFPLFVTFIFVYAPLNAAAEDGPNVVKDLSRLMDIPGLQSVAASETHLYALSSEDGLVVFRSHADSLQWLYSSQGMQRRGNAMKADVRFAYLTGSGNRLTIVEPTSVLGVYSATNLPSRPVTMARNGDHLFVGMDATGLYRLPLHSPEAFDTAPEEIEIGVIGRNRVYAIRSFGNTLMVLSSNNSLHQFRVEDGNTEHERSFSFGPAVSNLFVTDGQPIVTGSEGTVYEISSDGELRSLFQVNGAVDQLISWNGMFVVRTRSGEIWTAPENGGNANLLRRDSSAGNHIARTKGRLWMSEYDQLTTMTLRAPETTATTGNDNGTNGRLRLSPVPDQRVPYPRPVIIPIEFENPVPASQVQFQIRPSGSTALVRNKGFYWQPGSRDIGSRRFTIIASTADGRTDSTSFNVEVRAFNAPPRFNPVRPLSIPVGEEFTLPVRATAADTPDSDLIRYLGVDLPDGARINERTGLITWTPSRRQQGEHQFQVIATDQYGAASSLSVTVNVLTLSRGD